MGLYQRLTKGTEPKARIEIRLRKADFDVLTKIEMIEMGLGKPDALFKRPVNQGKKARKPRAI